MTVTESATAGPPEAPRQIEQHQFTSDTAVCAADLYLPADATGMLPCVVMGHGFSATKDSFALPQYARRFADAGYAVLAFDYRHFGLSEGQPRQLVHSGRQREDWRAAIAYARQLEQVDPQRIVLWGSSFSGGHVLALAADDPEIAAVIAQVPAIDPVKGAGTETAPVGVQLRLLLSAVRDALHGLLRRQPVLIPVVAPHGQAAAMTEPEANKLLVSPLVVDTTWRNEFAPRIAFAMPRYVTGTAERLTMPVLFCVAQHDVQTSPQFTLDIADAALKAETRIYPVGHFGLYHGAGFAKAVADQIDFLSRHLQS